MEARKRAWQPPVRPHLSRVHPVAFEVPERRARIRLTDVVGERPGLLALVGDHLVAEAPIELQRHPGACELLDVVVGASQLVRTRIGARRTADLLAGEA